MELDLEIVTTTTLSWETTKASVEVIAACGPLRAEGGQDVPVGAWSPEIAYHVREWREAQGA